MTQKDLDLLEKAKEVRKQFQETTFDFNVFEAIGVSNYELPMTNLLYELLLLRTNGTHGKEMVYLRRFFIDVLGLNGESDDDLSRELLGTRVYREYKTDEGRKIDLVIDTPNRFIPIEVKVWSDEGYNQCRDYFLTGKDRNERKGNKQDWGLFFLTWDRHLPKSTEGFEKVDKEKIHPISWGKEIAAWLGKIRNTKEQGSVLYVVIGQYRDAIMNFTAKEGELLEMAKKITWNEEDVKALSLLNESFKNAKIDSLKNLFEKIRKALISNNFENIDDVHMPDVEKFYGHKQTYPGIGCKVKDEDSDSGSVLSVRFEIGDSPYIGFQVQSGDKVGDKEWAKSCIKEDKRPKLINDNQYGWIYYIYIKPADWSQTTFSLRNDDYACCFLRNKENREKFANEIIEKFQELNGWLVGKE